ncbi:uncharacterized protein LOC111057275 isoform X1 [Nilaparvata lugens]|uniref:uncharacterized protein LOC111057275 isoform X1 n=2 Tax=Nilaparvata lugens TaxID=108931 RepID=UPI00193D49B5|nr:uncharacterized protein LOC111057275 isoform X1 [Nilaparvata lugens]
MLVVMSAQAGTVTCYAITTGIIPAISGFIKISTGDLGDDVLEKEIPMPVAGSWLPFSINNLSTYSLLAGFQQFAISLHLFIYMGWFAMTSSAMMNISSALKLLACFVDEMDERLGGIVEGKPLDLYIKFMVDYHNAIYKTIKDYDSATAVMMLLLYAVCVVEQCVSFFCIYEVNDRGMQITFLGVLIVNILILGSFTFFGQFIIDEGEKLRLSLNHSNWINKCNSYKRSLLIIMANTQKDVALKPAGLYVLDRHTIMLIANASYSYLSLMRNFKK